MLAIDARDRRANRRGRRDFVGAGPDHEGQRSIQSDANCDEALPERDIRFRLGIDGQRLVAHVANHADDFHPAHRLSQGDACADRVGVRPVASDRRFVDDNHQRRRLDVTIVEAAPANHRNSHRGKVAGRDQAWMCPHRRFQLEDRRVDIEIQAGVKAAERNG